MLTLPFVIAILISVLPFVIDKGRITLATMTLPKLAFILIGYAVCDMLFGGYTWQYIAIGTVVFASGCYIYEYFSKHSVKYGSILVSRPVKNEPMTMLTVTRLHQMILMVGLVGFFVLYHFAVGGIPILNEGVETARFDFTSSGLFGIPGRMVLFGWPFIVFYVTFYFWRTKDLRVKKLFYAVWGIYMLTCILSGFKSSIFSALTVFLVCRIMVGNPMSLKDLFSRYMLGFSALAILYAVWMLSRYATMDTSSLIAVISYFKYRIASLPAQPGHYAMMHYSAAADGHFYLLQDFQYFMWRYFHIGGDLPNVFTLDKIVSAATFEVALTSSTWVVPVTVGPFAQWYVDFGLAGAMISMFVTGLFFMHGAYRGLSEKVPFRAAAWGLVIMVMNQYILNGNFVYCLVNVAMVLAFMAFLNVFSAYTVAWLKSISR